MVLCFARLVLWSYFDSGAMRLISYVAKTHNKTKLWSLNSLALLYSFHLPVPNILLLAMLLDEKTLQVQNLLFFLLNLASSGDM